MICSIKLFGRYFFILLVVLIHSSCDLFQKEESREAVARVKDKTLYMDEVQNILSEGMSTEDSATLVSNYVNNWINEMLLLDKAELNLKAEQKDFKKQLEKYRNSLLVYTYEKKIIQQQLDTNVLLSEIEDYYLTNQQNFILKEGVYKIVTARFNKNTPQLDQIRKIYSSKKEKDMKSFIDFCHQFAMNFYDEKEKWTLYEDLAKFLPLNSNDHEQNLMRNKYFELEDSVSYYFTNVIDYKPEGSVSPLSFEKERIKSIIINQRKLSLLKKMKRDLYENALAKKDFEIYAEQ